MLVLPIYARLVGLLIGSRVELEVAPAVHPASLGFGRLETLRLTATTTAPSSEPSGAPLPLEAFSLSGEDVVLGWKPLALLLAPAWAIFARPTLLPLLLFAWIKLPGMGRGELEWEMYVNSQSLERGLWRWMLGLVLDGIGRTSLPGVLATLNPDGSSNPMARLPRSLCTGVSVARGGKLVLDGELQAQLQAPAASGQPAALSGPIDYTLRMGLRPGRADAAGNVVERGARPSGELRSCLRWETPELKLSLGDGPLARLLPQLWVPVLSESGVLLPRAVELRRAVVSEAGDGVSASGALALSRPADGEPYALAVRPSA